MMNLEGNGKGIVIAFCCIPITHVGQDTPIRHNRKQEEQRDILAIVDTRWSVEV